MRMMPPDSRPRRERARVDAELLGLVAEVEAAATPASQPPAAADAPTGRRPAGFESLARAGLAERQVWVRGERMALAKNKFAVLPALAGAPARDVDK